MCRLALWRCPRARAQSDPVATPSRSSRSGSPSGTVRARLCQCRCRVRRSAMRPGRLRWHGLRLFSEAFLCLLEAARLHRVLPRTRKLLLAERLLVRFLRPALLQLSWRIAPRLLTRVEARPMQRYGGRIRDIEAGKSALRRDAADQVAMLPRELPQALALGAEHER